MRMLVSKPRMQFCDDMYLTQGLSGTLLTAVQKAFIMIRLLDSGNCLVLAVL